MNKMREAAQMESHLGSLQDKENVHHRATSVSQGHVFTSSMPKNNDIEVQVTRIIESNISKIQKDFKFCLEEIHQLRKELLSSSHVSKRFSKSASPDNHRPSKRQEVFFDSTTIRHISNES
jgi:3-phenylpropionate/cinnamic acid dioxygenase small subunit